MFKAFVKVSMAFFYQYHFTLL